MPYLAATAKTANSCDRTAAEQHTPHKPVHHNDYVRLYSVIQEIDKPLAFHAGYHWQDASLATVNRFVYKLDAKICKAL